MQRNTISRICSASPIFCIFGASTISRIFGASTVAHFARKVRGTNIAAAKHGLKNNKIMPKTLTMFATCSWPSLCKQSELLTFDIQNLKKNCVFLLNNKVRRSFEAKHCSSLCSQSEGAEYCGGQARTDNPTKSYPKALTMFATCSWPSLCSQSELQTFAPSSAAKSV